MLTKNDKVAIIAPAAQFCNADRILLQQSIDLLESWSLQVEVFVEESHHFYLAGTDGQRQQHLNAVLTDHKIKAIFCTRGGYGSARLLAGLPDSTAVNSKMLIGCSDISALHLAMATSYPQVQCIHGPNVATKQLLNGSESAMHNQKSLYDCLFVTQQASYNLEFITPGKTTGKLIGGCLSLISTAIGTPYFPNLSGSILLIEDVGEAPYKIDRMLQHLINTGLTAGLKGIVFAEMHNCTDPYNDLKAIIHDLFCSYDLPIGFGLTTGHGLINNSIPLNSTAILDSEKGSFSIQ